MAVFYKGVKKAKADQAKAFGSAQAPPGDAQSLASAASVQKHLNLNFSIQNPTAHNSNKNAQHQHGNNKRGKRGGLVTMNRIGGY